MNLLLALLLACVGFASLALAMDRHHRQLRQCVPSHRQRQWLRLLGSLGLAVSLAICLADAGWASGIVLWLGILSLAALTIVLTLTAKVHDLTTSKSRR